MQGLQSSGNFLSIEGPRQAGTEGSWLWWLLGMEPNQRMGLSEGGEDMAGLGERAEGGGGPAHATPTFPVPLPVLPAGLILRTPGLVLWPREPWSGYRFPTPSPP